LIKPTPKISDGTQPDSFAFQYSSLPGMLVRPVDYQLGNPTQRVLSAVGDAAGVDIFRGLVSTDVAALVELREASASKSETPSGRSTTTSPSITKPGRPN
jgi:hypothetical protein